MSKQLEKIFCAATWYKDLKHPVHSPVNIDIGIVLCGFGHAHIIGQVNCLTGKRSVLPEIGRYEHGFLTSKNRFVDRKEAWNIAEKANQIVKVTGSNGTLYSEDLY